MTKMNKIQQVTDYLPFYYPLSVINLKVSGEQTIPEIQIAM